jgi:hypothetical protein
MGVTISVQRIDVVFGGDDRSLLLLVINLATISIDINRWNGCRFNSINRNSEELNFKQICKIYFKLTVGQVLE